jgi:DNA-binding transcriptional LysR family regulator
MSTPPFERADWERQRAFLEVVRTGSLSAAARSLGMVQPTLRRRIDELEHQFGAALFVRSSAGLVPTSLATHLVKPAEAMEAAAKVFARTASAEWDAAAGTVRVAASEVVGAEFLPPIFRDIRRTHPGLRIELVLSDQREDLLAQRADIAVRMAPPNSDDLVTRRMADMPLGLFVHADFLGDHALPATLEEAAQLPAIGYETETIAVRRLRAAGLPLPWPNAVLVTDSGLGQLAAIRAGVGMGVSFVGLGKRAPDLVHVVPAAFQAALETWLVYPKELRTVRRVSIVADALAVALQ